MCRTKELGGRRCPQHTDPVKHAAYNARRRELYAAKKNQKSSTQPLESLLPAIHKTRVYGVTENSRYTQEAEEYYEKMKKETLTALNSDDFYVQIMLDEHDEPDELMSLNGYSTSGYQTIRSYLSHPDSFEPSASAKLDKTIKGIDSAIERAPKVEPRLLYRGIKIPAFVEDENVSSWVEEKFPVGEVIAQDNYVSTSVNPYMASYFGETNYNAEAQRSILMEIVSSNGAPLGEDISANAHEREILLSRKSRFKIVAVHENAEVRINENILGAGKGFESVKPFTLIQVVDITENQYSDS